MRTELNVFEPGTRLFIVTENVRENNIVEVEVINDSFCNVLTLAGIENTRKTECRIMGGKYKDTVIYITGFANIYKTFSEALKAYNRDILMKIQKCQDNVKELEAVIKKEKEKEEYLKKILK